MTPTFWAIVVLIIVVVLSGSSIRQALSISFQHLLHLERHTSCVVDQLDRVKGDLSTIHSEMRAIAHEADILPKTTQTYDYD